MCTVVARMYIGNLDIYPMITSGVPVRLWFVLYRSYIMHFNLFGDNIDFVPCLACSSYSYKKNLLYASKHAHALQREKKLSNVQSAQLQRPQKLNLYRCYFWYCEWLMQQSQTNGLIDGNKDDNVKYLFIFW